jgi:putative transposase
MDSARALVAKGRGIAMVSRTMGVSRAQLSLRINRSADWQTGANRRNEEADAEILSAILNIISDMPSYGYRRVWGILRKQRRTEDSHLNAKRLYRIMSEHNLLLLSQTRATEA